MTRRFLEVEHLGSILLLAATAAALLWANSPWSASYEAFWNTGLGQLDRVVPGMDLHVFVNDALMTVFFFVIGLEIMRELTVGQLRDRRAAVVPAVAAAGGMVVPAAIFVVLTIGQGVSRGWGIPMATDIAFSLGVVALLGSRVPPGAKVFLLALAVVDDIGAIAVIAVVYSDKIDLAMLGAAASALAVIVAMRRLGVQQVVAYCAVGVLAWWCMFRSGVHATTVGVALGLLTPRLVADRLETRLHPWSSFVIVPLFALANAGVHLGGGAAGEPAPLAIGTGVVAGLVLGKPLGITAATWLAVRCRIGVLPPGVTMRHVLGLGAVAGVGFTVSLFVAELAYEQAELIDAAKLGILVASLLAAAAGAVLLTWAGRRRSPAARPVRAAGDEA